MIVVKNVTNNTGTFSCSYANEIGVCSDMTDVAMFYSTARTRKKQHNDDFVLSIYVVVKNVTKNTGTSRCSYANETGVCSA